MLLSLLIVKSPLHSYCLPSKQHTPSLSLWVPTTKLSLLDTGTGIAGFELYRAGKKHVYCRDASGKPVLTVSLSQNSS